MIDIPTQISPVEDVPGFKAGYVAIVGRPNVGKSTLLNHLLGQKIAIVTNRPQTTRTRILGIKNLPMSQLVFFDTPGIHRPLHGLGRHMVKEARAAIHDVDVILLMVEPTRRKPGAEDLQIIETLRTEDKPVVLAINKIDSIKKEQLLPLMQNYSELFDFERIIPISALKGQGTEDLLNALTELMPESPKLYPDDLLTDSYERFVVSELIREKVMLKTHDEVPHSSAVEIKVWEEGENALHIAADIYVEKDGQKGIIIGRRGQKLKEIGIEARRDIEALLDEKVFLELFVKVVRDWRMKKSVLTDLGFK